MATTQITVESTIDASLEKTWNYYTLPEHITQWNFAHPSWHCPRASNDVRVGGTSNVRMEAKDGSFGFDFITIYSEVVQHSKLAYAMEDGRKALITFKEKGSSTVLTITFDAESQNPVEMQKDGWQSILNNFKHYTETH